MMVMSCFVYGGLVLSVGCSSEGLEGDTPPIPIVSIGEESIEVVRASYCWNTGCVDYAGPPDILEGKAPYPVKKGEKIRIQFDYEPIPNSISVSRMLSTKDEWVRDVLVDGMLTVPKEEGIYYYDLLANWYSEEEEYGGDSYYAFVIKVE